MSTSNSSNTFVTVDDNQLIYSDLWSSSTNNDGELQGTKTVTQHRGASATFRFNGKQEF